MVEYPLWGSSLQQIDVAKPLLEWALLSAKCVVPNKDVLCTILECLNAPFKTSDNKGKLISKLVHFVFKDTKEESELDDTVRELRKNCELTADELSFERMNADPDLFECLNVWMFECLNV